MHFCDSPLYGPYWSVTRYRDIMTVDASHQTYSSDAAFGGITLRDVPVQYRKEAFIAMDPPRHDEQRKIVAPIVAPPNLAKMSSTIRERAIRILEGLPRGEVFDWVDRVSIELTTQMLSTLFDFPFEERRTLTRWSNASTSTRAPGPRSIQKSATPCCRKCSPISPRSGRSARSSRRNST